MTRQPLRTLDPDRQQALIHALGESALDGLLVALPTHVLLLSGYFPVVGVSLAVFCRDGQLALVVPADEQALASESGAPMVHAFSPGSLDELSSLVESVQPVLRQVLDALGLNRGTIGLELGAWHQPASYVSMNLYGVSLARLVKSIRPNLRQVPADDLLVRQRMVKTPGELERIASACRIAERAFVEGFRVLRVGSIEVDVASAAAAWLARTDGEPAISRAGGAMFCMSGPNAALAYAAYQRSRQRRVGPGDAVLLHCNSCADGYFTDITRSWILPGGHDDRLHALAKAIADARATALDAVRPGIPAREVDAAARAVMHRHGFDDTVFKHPTGHGVGFAAINHHAPPRLHPQSPDTLESGMVFNIEPAGYLAGQGGLRHCDMVAVTPHGYRLLTPFLEEVIG